MAQPGKIRALDPGKPAVVVAEGSQDVMALQRLVEDLRRHDILVGCAGGGGEAFLAELKAITTLPHFRDWVKSLAVVADADDDPSEAFRSICAALDHASRNGIRLVPPPRPGTYSSADPRVGVFLWPMPGKKGCLESLCLGSVAGDGRIPCIAQYLTCAKDAGAQLATAISQRCKARAHAFMATTPDPRAGVGAGFDHRRNVWDMNSPVWQPIKDFLQQL
jgi:hypothetical protein